MPSLVFTIVGIGCWIVGYFYDGRNDDATWIKVPKWFSTMLGRPNNVYLNAWSIGIQIMGYLLLIGAIFAWLIVPPGAIRQTILFIWFSILLVGDAMWLFLAPRLFK